jgi:hypothetical protein
MDENFTQAIGLTSPDEMAALHDAGQAIVDSAGSTHPSGVKIDSITFADRSVAGGVDAVLSSMTVDSNGDRIQITQGGGCYSIQAQGHSQRLCASDLSRQMGGVGSFLPPAFTKVVQDFATGMMNSGIGIVASQVDGQWYVSPGRTVTQLTTDVFSSISADDFAALLQLGSH